MSEQSLGGLFDAVYKMGQFNAVYDRHPTESETWWFMNGWIPATARKPIND